MRNEKSGLEKLEYSASPPKYNFIPIIKDTDSLELETRSISIPDKDEKPELPLIECDNSIYYGNPDSKDNFRLKNLFSEITTDYERAIARINLGVGGEWTNEWGNIKGQIIRQKDLTEYIDNLLIKKADLESPRFTGKPLVPHPMADDKSTQVPTTQWVMDMITAHGGGGGSGTIVKKYTVSPNRAFVGDGPIEVKILWEYTREITEQSINGVSLDPEIREYTTTVEDTTQFILSFKYGEIEESSTAAIIYHLPIYYGVYEDVTKCDKSFDDILFLEAGVDEYIWLTIPNAPNARLSVNGFVGGFIDYDQVVIHGAPYYKYRSVHSNLGEVTIDIL